MSDEDYILWKKAVETVKPLHSSMRSLTALEVTVIKSSTPKQDAAIKQSLIKRCPASLPKSSTASLDLHGLTTHDAHRATIDFIAATQGRATITIITGKSGQIRQEFERWVEGIPKVHSVTPKCDGGAFTVRILKSYR